MRHHFYGDRNDVWKWSIVLNEAEAGSVARSVVYVAMLTREQGHVFDPVPDARPEVVRFFAAEREEFAKGPVRHVGRLRRLFETLGKNIDIIEDRYTHPNRARYFKVVTDLLGRRPPSRHDVVVIDPDTGIEPDKPDASHVCLEELRAVWEALRGEDVLIVYQHQYRAEDWVAAVREKLARGIGVEPTAARSVGDSRVQFLIAHKQEDARKPVEERPGAG
jgi:hypothetical protein